jgi:hypothetical protein
MDRAEGLGDPAERLEEGFLVACEESFQDEENNPVAEKLRDHQKKAELRIEVEEARDGFHGESACEHGREEDGGNEQHFGVAPKRVFAFG